MNNEHLIITIHTKHKLGIDIIDYRVIICWHLFGYCNLYNRSHGPNTSTSLSVTVILAICFTQKFLIDTQLCLKYCSSICYCFYCLFTFSWLPFPQCVIYYSYYAASMIIILLTLRGQHELPINGVHSKSDVFVIYIALNHSSRRILNLLFQVF